MRACTVLAIATAVVVVVAAAPASGSQLAITARDVPGMRPAGTGKQIALRALGTRRPQALRRATRSGAAFANGRRRLTIGVFTLRSAAAARRVPASASTSVAGGLARAVVRRRVGRAVAVVRYEIPGKRTARALQGARAYAASQAVRLRRLLAQTAWERTLGEIRRDGSYSTQTALRAFAIAYGSLPGAKRPRGRLGVPRSGTAAMRMVASKWASLTPAQRAAIDRALGARHGGAAKTPPRARAAAETYAPAYQAIADKYTTFFAGKLPQAGAVPIKVFKESDPINDEQGDEVYGEATVINDEGEWGTGTPAYCRIRMGPLAQAQEGKLEFQQMMAHEVFHCFEFWLMPAWSDRPDWIMEGLAEWASIAASGVPASVGAGWYADYLETIDAPLFARSYTAVGFWGHADEIAGGLWPKIPAIMNASGNGEAFSAAGADAQAFVDSWASAAFRYPSAGAAWYQQRPYAIPHTEFDTAHDAILDDAALSSEPYALRQYGVLMDAERPLVKLVGAAGTLRAGTHDKDFGTIETKWLCYGGQCTCPAGQSSTIPPHEKLASEYLALGLTGGGAAAAGGISFHALDEFCAKSTGVSVSGATNYTISQPAFCVVTPGRMVVEIAWNAGGAKQAHITIEIAGYDGKGIYGPSATTVTAYDYRSSSLQHQWGPGPGSVAVTSAGTAYGFGANGTVNATLYSTGEKISSVVVDGSWSCTRRDGQP